MPLPSLDETELEVLEFLATRSIVADPKTIVANLDVGKDKANNSLRKLERVGLVERPESVPEDISARGLFTATDLGRKYADGDMTLRELRELFADSDE